MLSAAELVDAIQRRMQLVEPHRRRTPGELPPGWQGWLASLQVRVGAVTGATLSTFFLLEVFGTRNTLWLACLLNALVALVAKRPALS